MQNSVINVSNASSPAKRPREPECEKTRKPVPPLLLATTHSLNASQSKMVSIGISFTDELEDATPIVKFYGRAGYAITMSESEWASFKNEMIAIDSWFDEDLELLDLTLKPFGQKKISCTKTYKKKSILLENTEDERQPKKPRHSNLPAVVFQKTTYEGLKKLVPLIDLQLHTLRSEASLLTGCVEALLQAVRGVATEEEWDFSKDNDDKIRNACFEYAQRNEFFDNAEGGGWQYYIDPENMIHRRKQLLITELVCQHFEYIKRKSCTP